MLDFMLTSAVWRKAEDEKAEKEKLAVAQRVKDQEASKKAASEAAKRSADDKAKEEAAEAEMVNGIAKRWKSFATGGRLTTPAGDVRSQTVCVYCLMWDAIRVYVTHTESSAVI